MTNFSIEFLKSQIDESGNLAGQFKINQLKLGQGITVGNILRRVLLKDLTGTAIRSIRINNAPHEFSVLEGVREDILEIILNLKQIIIKNKTNKPGTGVLIIHGPAVITANYIEISDNLEIMNPNHYIATISGPNILEIELEFECGTGYKLSNNSNSDNSIGSLRVDSIFMPVQAVNYRVEQIPENRTESLIIDITTNKSTTPQAALSNAFKFIISFFSNLLESEFPSNVDHLKDTNKKILDNIDKSISIEDLELSIRAYNCLKRAQINTISELLKYSPENLIEIKSFGRKSVNEVFDALKTKLGIILR